AVLPLRHSPNSPHDGHGVNDRQLLYRADNPHRIHVVASHRSTIWRITMVRTAWMLTLAVAVASLVLFAPGRATADIVVYSPPVVSYYYPAPTVTYYSPPVAVAPVPTVSYYYAPAVTYYRPAYAVAPAAVTTTRYGLLGRPRVSTSYYPPVIIGR